MSILDRSQRLKKQLGLFDVFAISAGAMFSSGFFLLPGLAAAKTGPSVALAFVVAGLIMIPPMLSKAELSTAMPRAGGTYYFLDRSFGPLAGTVGGVGTWLVMALKSSFALIGMGAYLTLMFDVPIRPVAIALVFVFMLVNLVGVKETTGLQRALVVLLLTIISGYLLLSLHYVFFSGTDIGLFKARFSPYFTHGADGFFLTVGFVVVSYAGLTKVASVAEEVKQPERNLPMGMILSMAMAAVLYGIGVSLMVAVVPSETLVATLTPVADAALIASQSLPRSLVLSAILLAAFCGFAAAGNAAMMSASRYPMAMARDGILPAFFAKLSHRFSTPVRSILLTAGLMVAILLLFDVEGIAKLASAAQLLIFGIVNISVIVMRESHIESYDPGFRSPLYPWLQLGGLAGSLWLIVQLGVASMLFTAGLIAISMLWYHYYARHHTMRRGAIYHIFERLGQHRFGGLDRELRSILKEKGLRTDDPFDEIIARAKVIDASEGMTFPDLVEQVTTYLGDSTGVAISDLQRRFLEGTRVGATPVSHGAALPHLRIPGLHEPEVVLVRARSGIVIDRSELPPEYSDAGPIYAFFFLVSPEDNPSQHLRILAKIADRVDDEDFTSAWNGARNQHHLKEVLLRDERFVSFRLDPEHTSGLWIGRSIAELDIADDCLIAVIYRGNLTMIPRGSTMLEDGDRITLLGEPASIARLRHTMIDDGGE